MAHRRPVDHVVPAAVGAVVVIGPFDGVHRSHLAAVASATRLARRHRSNVVAVVADQGEGTAQLMHVARRCELLLSAGVSSAFVAPLPTPSDVRDVLGPTLERMQPVAVLVDPLDWPMQPAAELSAYLRRLGVLVVDAARDGQHVAGAIDTSSIIEDVRRGDVVAAAATLGRPYELVGTVAARRPATPGGSPSVRVVVAPGVVLPHAGIYAATTLIGRRWVGAVVNVGADIDAHLVEPSSELHESEVSFRLFRKVHDAPSRDGV